MSMQDDLDALKVASDKLSKLLDDHETGLSSWHFMVAKQVQEISDIGVRCGMVSMKN